MGTVTRLWAGRSGIRIPVEERYFFFFKTSRTSPRRSQQHIHRLLWLFTRDKVGWGVRFSTQLRQVPSLRMSGAIHLLPLYALMVSTGTPLPLLVLQNHLTKKSLIMWIWSLGYVITLPLPSIRGSPKWSPSLRFPLQNPVYASPVPHTCYMTRPSHASRFDHPNNIWWAIKISKLPICSFLHSPVTSSFLGPNTLLSTLFSNTPNQCSTLNVSDQVSHPYTTTGTVIVLYVLIFVFSVERNCIEVLFRIHTNSHADVTDTVWQAHPTRRPWATCCSRYNAM